MLMTIAYAQTATWDRAIKNKEIHCSVHLDNPSSLKIYWLHQEVQVSNYLVPQSI